MKKIVIIGMLFIPSLLFGQMNITKVILEPAFGYKVTYKLYKAKIPTNNYYIFLHGTGEKGPADGSKLDWLDIDQLDTTGKVIHRAPNTYLKLAQTGYEFPFNIIAFQIPDSFQQLKQFAANWVKQRFNADVIIVGGLSLGGMATYDMVLYDYYHVIDAIAPVCGMINSSQAINYPSIDIWSAHGDKDTTVPYNSDKSFIFNYNITHSLQATFTTYPGVAHNAWDYAYRVTPGQDQQLQWLIQQFEKHKKKPEFNIEEFRIKVDKILLEMQD